MTSSQKNQGEVTVKKKHNSLTCFEGGVRLITEN